MASRQYDLVLYGATGYTGKYTAECLQTSAPTDLNWAIAGRNSQKLQSLLKELESISKDRKQPGESRLHCIPRNINNATIKLHRTNESLAIEVLNHNLEELEKLAKKTKVLITTVGPYAIHGTPVVEACAKNGTHYLDV
jgi:short subunit dehydrogenase-like uncharacterized protein